MDNSKDTPSPGFNLADETGEEATQRDKFPQRIERYGKAKTLSTAMADYISEFQPDCKKLIDAVSECGNWLLFHDYYTVNQIRLAKASFCRKHLLCPLCAIRRGAKMVEQKVKDVDQVLADNPNLELHMMTFTVKDGPDLKERFNHLTKNVQAFMKRRHLKKRVTESKKIKGAVWSYEIKRGSGSGLWHPHAHFVVLLDSNNLVSQMSLSEEWHKLTGDSFIVDIRPIKHDTEEQKIKAFCEVFKYALKFSEQPPEDTWHCYSTLNTRRFVGSCGLLYGVKEPLSMADNILDELPYHEYFYSYSRGTGYSLNSSFREQMHRAS